MKTAVKSLICVMLVLTFVLSVTACGNNRITMENFDKITCGTLNYSTLQFEGGMTLAEVKALLGEPADRLTTTIMGITSTSYAWGNKRKNITVSFVNGVAVLKVQTGLD